MSGAGARRGQPLIVLGALLLGWVGLRAVLWEEIALPGLPEPSATIAAKPLPPVERRASQPDEQPAQATPGPAGNIWRITPAPLALPPSPSLRPQPAEPVQSVEPAPLPEFVPAGGRTQITQVAAAHQLAWMAGVAQLPVPRFVMDRLGQTDRTASLMPAEARQARTAPLAARRWSVDGWLLLREGGAGSTATGLPSPSYGASQAGAVIRYRLSPTSNHRPSAYLRASTAVQRPRGEEVAVGLSARPLAQIPVSVQAEVRAAQLASGTRFRPAVGAVTELPRFSLPAGLSGEVYAQAGYVGGPDASAFVDGQVRIEHRLGRIGQGELRAGLGAWGGAQKGASRIDLGPSATVDFPLGSGRGRVSADWRLRAAGNAAPQSGPAITLSAGF